MLPIPLILCLFTAIPPAELRLLLLAVALGTGPVAGADWVRAGVTTNAAVWGRADGLQWAIRPGYGQGGVPKRRGARGAENRLTGAWREC